MDRIEEFKDRLYRIDNELSAFEYYCQNITNGLSSLVVLKICDQQQVADISDKGRYVVAERKNQILTDIARLVDDIIDALGKSQVPRDVGHNMLGQLSDLVLDTSKVTLPYNY